MASLLELGGIQDALLEMIFAALEDPTEEPEQQETLQSQLLELQSEIADKVDAIAAVMAAKQAELNYLAERREHFDRLVKSRQDALDRFKDYVKYALEKQAATALSGKEAKLRLVKNGGKAPVWINDDIDTQDFPTEAIVAKTSYSVSSEWIRSKLAETGTDELVGEDGRILAKLQERGTHLRIG
jgi:Siphovirus Gp157